MTSSWEKKRKPANGYKLPDTMFSTAASGGEEEELRRLFYVALTRAEKFLTVSYPQFKNDGKELRTLYVHCRNYTISCVASRKSENDGSSNTSF
jgi:superfamily I DNA/RNA helicase